MLASISILNIGLALPVELIIIAFFLGIAAFEIWMFVSAIRNPHITDTVKLLWVIGMLLLHPFVAMYYYFTDYQKTLR